MQSVSKLDEKRDYRVVKANDLIQRARYNLTVNQQKLIAYVISLIKPTDKELMMYEISVADFCELCGIDKTYFYTEFMFYYLKGVQNEQLQSKYRKENHYN